LYDWVWTTWNACIVFADFLVGEGLSFGHATRILFLGEVILIKMYTLWPFLLIQDVIIDFFNEQARNFIGKNTQKPCGFPLKHGTPLRFLV
jgi:hypothetical protein